MTKLTEHSSATKATNKTTITNRPKATNKPVATNEPKFTSTPLRIFVSHKHSRAKQAKCFIRLLNRLAPGRFNFFASSLDIALGDNWRDKVKEQIDSSDWLIALKSGGQLSEMEWVNHEISIFSEARSNQQNPELRRCIIVHDPDNRTVVFNHLQQFEASIDGCMEFLKYLLGTSNGRCGFNPYVGDDASELHKESVRLWEILVDKPEPRSLLPKGGFYYSAEHVKELASGQINNSVGVTLNRAAALIHGLNPDPNSDSWTGKYSDLKENMTKEQCDWIPLISYLTRKMFEQKLSQKAFLLYPDKENVNFYTPVVSELFEYASGDRQYELIYAPVETGFPRNTGSNKDLLFHLMALCFNTHWRLIDRYKDKVHEFASRERSGLVVLDDRDKELMGDMWKRMLIDIYKINIETKARGILNIERIYELFEPNDRKERAKDFKEWVDIVEVIKNECDTLSAQRMQELLERLEQILGTLIRLYSTILADTLGAKK